MGGNSDTKTLVNRKATQKNQLVSNQQHRDQFARNYNAMFSELPQNQNFQDSLRGYYGGASLADIGAKLARTNAFQPKVKPVTYKVETGGGFLDKVMKYVPTADIIGSTSRILGTGGPDLRNQIIGDGSSLF